MAIYIIEILVCLMGPIIFFKKLKLGLRIEIQVLVMFFIVLLLKLLSQNMLFSCFEKTLLIEIVKLLLVVLVECIAKQLLLIFYKNDINNWKIIGSLFGGYECIFFVAIPLIFQLAINGWGAVTDVLIANSILSIFERTYIFFNHMFFCYIIKEWRICSFVFCVFLHFILDFGVILNSVGIIKSNVGMEIWGIAISCVIWLIFHYQYRKNKRRGGADKTL